MIRQKGLDSLSAYGVGKEFKKTDLERLVKSMIQVHTSHPLPLRLGWACCVTNLAPPPSNGTARMRGSSAPSRRAAPALVRASVLHCALACAMPTRTRGALFPQNKQLREDLEIVGDWGGVTGYLRPGIRAHAVVHGEPITLPMAVMTQKRKLAVRGGNEAAAGGDVAGGGSTRAGPNEADIEKELTRLLMNLRREIAPGKETHAYGERGARAIAQALPMSRRQLAFVEGIGVAKAEKWGDKVSS